MRTFYFIAVLILLVSCNNSNEPQPLKKIDPNIDAAGLYNMLCASCHKCDVDLATGPSLKGVESRWKDKELMYEFIRNPLGVIQKDSYAAGLFKKYNAIMTPSTLTKEEIDAVLNYSNNAGRK